MTDTHHLGTPPDRTHQIDREQVDTIGSEDGMLLGADLLTLIGTLADPDDADGPTEPDPEPAPDPPSPTGI